MTSRDGIGGTDGGPSPGNVLPLFNDKPTAAGLPPQPTLVAELELILAEAKTGKITGMVFIGIGAHEDYRLVTEGKIPFNVLITALAKVNFQALYGDMIRDRTGQ